MDGISPEGGRPAQDRGHHINARPTLPLPGRVVSPKPAEVDENIKVGTPGDFKRAATAREALAAIQGASEQDVSETPTVDPGEEPLTVYVSSEELARATAAAETERSEAPTGPPPAITGDEETRVIGPDQRPDYDRAA